MPNCSLDIYNAEALFFHHSKEKFRKGTIFLLQHINGHIANGVKKFEYEGNISKQLKSNYNFN